MMKKYLFIALVMILSFVLTACDKTEEKNNTGKIKAKSVQNNKSPAPTTSKKNSLNFVANAYHPIIFAYKDENNVFSRAYVLGGSGGNKWFKITDFNLRGRLTKPEDFSVPQDMSSEEFQRIINNNYVDIDLAKGGETYKFYSNDKFITRSKGMKPTLTINGSTLDKILLVKVNPFKAEDDFIVGINGEWNALPRVPRLLENNTYALDMDGDSDNDILRLVQLSKKSKEETIDIDVILEKDGKNILVDKILVDGTYTASYRVLTLDINGDGRLEVLTVQSGHNTRIGAYEIDNGIAKLVLEYYNGD